MDSAEALAWWGGNIKYILIPYFLVNISAKHYQDWLMFVKII